MSTVADLRAEHERPAAGVGSLLIWLGAAGLILLISQYQVETAKPSLITLSTITFARRRCST